MRKTFLKKGVRELWAHKVQYLLLILVIGLGVGMFASFNNFSNVRWESMEGSYNKSEFMDTQVELRYDEYINLTTLDAILENNTISFMVQNYEYRLVYEVFINHTVDGEVKTTKGQVRGYEWFDDAGNYRDQDVNRPLFYVDDPDHIADPGARECYSERKFSQVYGLGSGDGITLLRDGDKMELKIIEQVAVPEFMYVVLEGNLYPMERSFGILALPIQTAVDLFHGSNGSEIITNDLVFHLKDSDDVGEFNARITEIFSEKGIIVKTTEKEENVPRYLLYTDHENDKATMAMYPIVIFSISGFGLVMALRRMIRNHRPQIGIFKALGVPNRSVLVYFGVIGVVIGLLGTGAGVLFAIPLNYSFNYMVETLLDFPVTDTSSSPEFIMIGGLISLTLCLSCTLIPAMVAMRIKPIDAIQKREGISKKKVGRLGVYMKGVRWMPVSVKLSIRNFLRKPGRSVSTILGVAMSFALFLAFMMAMDSMYALFDREAEGNNWDYEIMMQGFSPENMTADWSVRFEEIESINHGMVVPIELDEGQNPEMGLLYALEDTQGAFNFNMEKGSFKQGEILISNYQADEMGLDVGDQMEFVIPTINETGGYQRSTVELTISGIQDNHIGSIFYTDLATLQGLSNMNETINIVYLDMSEDGKIISVENGLIMIPGVSSVRHMDDMTNMLEDYSDIFMTMVYIMALISALLAAAIIYTMFKISAQERERDYATMKTLGTSIGKIAKLLAFEATYITVWGIGLGVIGAYGLANLMFANADEFAEFNIAIIFSWSGFFIGSMIIIGVVIIVSLLTIRYISKINIANVIRERSTG